MLLLASAAASADAPTAAEALGLVGNTVPVVDVLRPRDGDTFDPGAVVDVEFVVTGHGSRVAVVQVDGAPADRVFCDGGAGPACAVAARVAAEGGGTHGVGVILGARSADGARLENLTAASIPFVVRGGAEEEEAPPRRRPRYACRGPPGAVSVHAIAFDRPAALARLRSSVQPSHA